MLVWDEQEVNGRQRQRRRWCMTAAEIGAVAVGATVEVAGNSKGRQQSTTNSSAAVKTAVVAVEGTDQQ